MLAAAALLIGAAPAKKLLLPTTSSQSAPASAWRTIDPDDLLVIDLKNGGRVVVQLAPAFAPVHVANIKALARSNYWDGATVYRVQDNYVAQWGRNDSDKPFRRVSTAKPPAEYTRPFKGPDDQAARICRSLCAGRGLRRRLAGRLQRARRAGRTSPIATPASASAATCRPTRAPAASFTRSSATRPRQLDRVIAVVGRVVDGIDKLSSLAARD